jgi:hypothetical protein
MPTKSPMIELDLDNHESIEIRLLVEQKQKFRDLCDDDYQTIKLHDTFMTIIVM